MTRPRPSPSTPHAIALAIEPPSGLREITARVRELEADIKACDEKLSAATAAASPANLPQIAQLRRETEKERAGHLAQLSIARTKLAAVQRDHRDRVELALRPKMQTAQECGLRAFQDLLRCWRILDEIAAELDRLDDPARRRSRANATQFERLVAKLVSDVFTSGAVDMSRRQVPAAAD